MNTLTRLLLGALVATGCTNSGAPTASNATTSTSITTSTAVVTSTETSTSVAAAAGVPDGWHTVSSNDGKVSMALPESWVVADPKNPVFVETIEKFRKSNPALANLDFSKMYFMALDSKGGGDFTENVNINKQTMPQAIPIDDATAAMVKQQLVKSLPIQGDLDMGVVHLKAGDAFRYQTDLKLKNPKGGDLNYNVVGYMTFKGTEQYTVTFSTKPGSKAKSLEQADQAMATFEIK